eukprot:jgi/Ulvmu1/4499/UM002_0225.1
MSMAVSREISSCTVQHSQFGVTIAAAVKAMAENAQAQLDSAKQTLKSDSKAGITALRNVIAIEGEGSDLIQVKEQAITALTTALADDHDAQGLKDLLQDLRPMYAQMAKAKTARIVRTVIDALARIPDTAELQIQVCKEQIKWAREEKRSFLRQRIEMRLSTLLMETGEYHPALQLIGSLLTEVKRLDDKLLLVDVHLIESRLHHFLLNNPKSKAALTAARSAANSVYVPPSLQAEIDLQSGILNAEERDFKTAFSYFFEAFEQYNNLKSPKALNSLKYLLLCKIMSDNATEVASIISSKSGLNYSGPELEAMKLVAEARTQSSLTMLQEVLDKYKEQLEGDPIVNRHLNDLFKALLEQNLIRVIMPYSKVEIKHLAKLISLDAVTVEREISQMILDKKISGILDQGNGCLQVYEEQDEDEAYPAAIETINNMSSVVDALFTRSQKLVA